MRKEIKARIRQLRRMGWSAEGIARQTGVSVRAVAEVLQERHLLDQIWRGAGRGRSRKG